MKHAPIILIAKPLNRHMEENAHPLSVIAVGHRRYFAPCRCTLFEKHTYGAAAVVAWNSRAKGS